MGSAHGKLMKTVRRMQFRAVYGEVEGDERWEKWYKGCKSRAGTPCMPPMPPPPAAPRTASSHPSKHALLTSLCASPKLAPLPLPQDALMAATAARERSSTQMQGSSNGAHTHRTVSCAAWRWLGD